MVDILSGVRKRGKERDNSGGSGRYEIVINVDFQVKCMTTLTAMVQKEEDMYVAKCPEVGTVSQGKTIEEAVANLKEATELYLEEFPFKEGNIAPGRFELLFIGINFFVCIVVNYC